MKKSRIFKILVLSVMMVFMFTACSSEPAESKDDVQTSSENTNMESTDSVESTNENKTESADVTTEKTLVAAVKWLGADVDPANGWNGWTLMRGNSGECLATLNEQMEIVPQLADKWEVLDDLTWKFHIRQGVKFSNGKDMTPEAVKKSLERTIAKDERAKNSSKMESITVDGEYIIFKTSEPYGSLINNLTEPLFIIVDTDVDDETMAMTPVTTAPYQIVEYEPKVQAKLVANEYYWDGKPALDSYTLKMIKDPETRMLALQSGEVQIAQGLSGTALETLEKSGDFQIDKMGSLRVNYLGFNHNNKLLSDIHLRRAFSYAINREAIAKILKSVPVGAMFPPSAGYGYDQLDLEHYDFEQAKAELEAGGYVDNDGDGIVEKDGEKVSFTLPVVSKSAALAEIMQAQLKEVGIEMNIEIVENSYAQLVEGNHGFDLFLTNYVTATTGDSKRFLEQNYTTEGTDNFGHYSNLEFDKIVDKLIAEFDPAKRIELSIKAQQIANDDIANVYIVSPIANVVADKSVKNITVFPMDYYFMTKDMTVE